MYVVSCAAVASAHPVTTLPGNQETQRHHIPEMMIVATWSSPEAAVSGLPHSEILQYLSLHFSSFSAVLLYLIVCHWAAMMLLMQRTAYRLHAPTSFQGSSPAGQGSVLMSPVTLGMEVLARLCCCTLISDLPGS